MPRTFISLDLPAAIADHLHEITFGHPGMVWVPPHQYHLTLRFLGEVAAHTLENIRHTLHEVRLESFYFDLKGVGHFPLRGQPETLWVGVSACEALQHLRFRLDSALAHAGIGSEGRKFHPHVTLGRLKHGAARQIGLFEVEHSLFSAPAIPAESFHLYTSRLSPEGASHSLESTYPLDGILEGHADEDL